ncbi:MAG: hypothetical protein C4526_05030 [Nitrospiraceae bacterium]|nr:MAG: hypothetical protein C4526_05030 [Nitrospiraceae bacterium]
MEFVMHFNDLVQRGMDYFHANPAVAIAVAVILLFLLFRKPKLFLVLLFLALAAIGVNYLFDKLSSTGLEHKKMPFLE